MRSPLPKPQGEPIYTPTRSSLNKKARDPISTSSPRPRPSITLPSLRLLLCPRPGVGLDARLPLTHYLRCYMSAESFFHGGSTLRFGLEPVHFPFLRLEIAPSTTFSLRPSLLRVSFYKFIVPGFSFTLFDAQRSPSSPSLLSPSSDGPWSLLRPFFSPVLELQHRNTLLGTLLDPRYREAARQAVDKALTTTEAIADSTRAKRNAALRSFRQPSMPPVDPRQKDDPSDRLKERLEQRLNKLLDPKSKSSTSWPGTTRDDDLILDRIRPHVLPKNSKSHDSDSTSTSAAKDDLVRKGRSRATILGRMRMGRDGVPVIIPDESQSDNSPASDIKSPSSNSHNTSEPERKGAFISSSMNPSYGISNFVWPWSLSN